MNELIFPGVNRWRNATVSDTGLLVDVELASRQQNTTFRRLCCLTECPTGVARRDTVFPTGIQWLTDLFWRKVE